MKTMYYAASTNGFYDSEINTDIPQDAVVISQSLYDQLMADQCNGKRIQPGPGGNPIAVDPPGPTPEEAAEQNKKLASQKLTASDWATKSSIADPTKSIPFLSNQSEFFAYQNALRMIAVDPPTVPVDVWPKLPKAVWSN